MVEGNEGHWIQGSTLLELLVVELALLLLAEGSVYRLILVCKQVDIWDQLFQGNIATIVTVL